MAKAANTKSATKVTRIKASDSSERPAKKTASRSTAASKPAEVIKSKPQQKPRRRRLSLGPVGRYLKGSWYELRQVRWPDRRATWGMTGALLVFTLFFIVVILLLDYGFTQLFKLLLGSN